MLVGCRHLLDVGKDSTYGTWISIKAELSRISEEEERRRPFTCPTYPSMATKFWNLAYDWSTRDKKAGDPLPGSSRFPLIEKVGVEESDRGGWERTLYAIVPGKETAVEWENPQTALRDPERFDRTKVQRKKA